MKPIEHLTPEQIVEFFKGRDKDIAADVDKLVKAFLNPTQLAITETRTNKKIAYEDVVKRLDTRFMWPANYALLKDFFEQVPNNMRSASQETLRIFRWIIPQFEDMASVIASQQEQIQQLKAQKTPEPKPPVIEVAPVQHVVRETREMRVDLG